MQVKNKGGKKPRFEIAPGMRLGLWTTIEERRVPGDFAAYWLCRCVCGRQAVMRATRLRGVIVGCRPCTGKVVAAYPNRIRPPARPRTSLKRHPLHGTWRSMIRRCHKPGFVDYPNYGARGISVCPRWRESFHAFVEDMGPRPTARHTIDRRDNDAGYSPENCRWATALVQCNNKRANRIVTFDGKRTTVAQLARAYGVEETLLRHRLEWGWSIEKAVLEPVLPPGERWKRFVSAKLSPAQIITLRSIILGREMSVRAASSKFGVSRPLILKIVKEAGWPA